MSQTVLKLIPTNPDFVPAQTKQVQAKAIICQLFKNASVDLKTTSDVEFIDQGSNFESVFCNLCGKEIDMQVWQDEMDKANKNHFKELSIITPCCHKKTSLNNLQYHSPAGFAKFQIAITDPGNGLSAHDLSELEKVLGTPVRKIWAHY